MPDKDGNYGTIDLAEATVLAEHNFEYKLGKLSKSQASWTFLVPVDPNEQEQFWELVQEYQEGLSRVEPRSFMLEVKKMRSELYSFLGPDAPKRQAPAQQTA